VNAASAAPDGRRTLVAFLFKQCGRYLGNVLPERFCTADVHLGANRIWIEIWGDTQSLQDSADGLHQHTKRNIPTDYSLTMFFSFLGGFSSARRYWIFSLHLIFREAFASRFSCIIEKHKRTPRTAGKDSVQVSNVCTVTLLKAHTHANTRWRHKHTPTHTLTGFLRGRSGVYQTDCAPRSPERTFKNHQIVYMWEFTHIHR